MYCINFCGPIKRTITKYPNTHFLLPREIYENDAGLV